MAKRKYKGKVHGVLHAQWMRRKLGWDPGQRWSFAIERAFLFLEKLQASPAIGGEVWKAKMIAYYSERLRDLIRTPPAGRENDALRYRQKYARLFPDVT